MAQSIDKREARTAISVAILGISGRMGHALLTALDERPSLVLTGATASANSRWLGKDAGEAGGSARRDITVESDPAAALRGTPRIGAAAVAIDFTLPQATVANVTACVAARCAVVVGTTGHDEEARRQITDASRSIPIVMAPNMSLGVNLLLKLVEIAASSLESEYDIEVFEAHHRNKKDAPSGTALALGAAAAKGRGSTLNELARYPNDHARHGATGPRQRGTIGFSVFRGGDVVGDHTVTFAGTGERIELTHRASDRLAFARGAVTAAQWLVGRPAGLYSMQHVLGLK
jgi:4-hydroxy-tetrahydrodipicolinate reductase